MIKAYALALAAILLLTATVAPAKVYTVQDAGATGSIDVPEHKLVAVTEKPEFVFYSIKADYPQPDDGPYANVPAEMSVRIVRGSVDEAAEAQRKILIGPSRDIAKEVKRDGSVIWLLKDRHDTKASQTLRGVQFVPAGNGATLMIDATNTRLRNMPAKSRKQIEDLLAAGLKSIKLGDTDVVVDEVRAYLQLK